MQRIGAGCAQQRDRATEQIDAAPGLANADVDFAERAQQAGLDLRLRLRDRHGIQARAGLVEQLARTDIAAARLLRIGVLEQTDQEIGDLVCGMRFGARHAFRTQRALALEREPRRGHDDRHNGQRRDSDANAMPAHEFGDAIADAVRPGGKRTSVEITRDVFGQGRRGGVTPRRILVQGAAHDVFQVAINARGIGAQPVRRHARDAPRPRLAPAFGVAVRICTLFHKAIRTG